MEDALRSKHEIEKSGQQRKFPSEAQFLAVLGHAFDRFVAMEPHARDVAVALDLDGDVPVTLTWDDDAEAGSRIVDVIIGGRFRPTRETWQKLIDAGLPMCSWQEASEGWDMSEQQREVRRDLL